MSKSARKNRSSRRHTKPYKQNKQKTASPIKREDKKKVAAFIIIAILAVIPFSYGKYFEFNSPGPFDSGAYVYSAAHILDGAEIGVEEKASAQPGTLLVNMLGVRLFGFNETGPKLMQTILQAAALVLMFIAMRKLFGTLSGAVGVIVASVYLSSPLIAKFGNVKEQYMIAFMVMGVSCLVLYQLGGKWWLAVLAGVFASWAPLFKQTGTSVIGAMGLFVIAQPLLKHRTWKQTGVDILLLLAGVVVGIGPLYLWIIVWDVQMSLPYTFAWKTLAKMLPAGGGDQQAKAASDYVGLSRKLVPFSQQWPRVLRYYGYLILPVALAAGAIAARILRMIRSAVSRGETKSRAYDRFVLLFGVWWVLDMAFVWISPRSYEQYYLPLNASAAMLGGYLVALYHGRLSQKPGTLTTPRVVTLDIVFLAAWAIGTWVVLRAVFPRLFEQAGEHRQYRVALSAAVIILGLGLVGSLRDKLSNGINTFRWTLVGLIGLACMVVMSWHIFSGIEISPHSGGKYPGGKRRGYTQKWQQVSRRRKDNLQQSWEIAGDYIRIHSGPTDKIYVWGWVPGVYVKAQRFSSASAAFSMPRPAPDRMDDMVATLLGEFEQQMPKFIVDTRKLHIPMERPPYQLWPIIPQGFMGARTAQFLPRDKNVIERFDKTWSRMLRENFDEAEALRYEKMQPFREFVMENYQLVEPELYEARRSRRQLVHGRFGELVLFELRDSTAAKEQQ
jgi:hypothetical protein